MQISLVVIKPDEPFHLICKIAIRCIPYKQVWIILPPWQTFSVHVTTLYYNVMLNFRQCLYENCHYRFHVDSRVDQTRANLCHRLHTPCSKLLARYPAFPPKNSQSSFFLFLLNCPIFQQNVSPLHMYYKTAQLCSREMYPLCPMGPYTPCIEGCRLFFFSFLTWTRSQYQKSPDYPKRPVSILFFRNYKKSALCTLSETSFYCSRKSLHLVSIPPLLLNVIPI